MAESDIPSSLAAMAAQARPARVVMFDVSEPLPDVRADEHYRDAWIVVCKAGVPRCMVIVDLPSDASAIDSRLHKLVEQVEMSNDDIEEAPLSDSELPRISVVVPT